MRKCYTGVPSGGTVVLDECGDLLDGSDVTCFLLASDSLSDVVPELNSLTFLPVRAGRKGGKLQSSVQCVAIYL